MTRLLLLLFVFNTLLSPVSATAMVSFGANNAMNETHESVTSTVINTHCATMSSHDACEDNTSGDLCKANCATSCTTSPAHIASFSFGFPFMINSRLPEIADIHFYNRSVSPELRPPLV
jgi:hypothetical protein